MSRLELMLGYHFAPSDVQLISYYLERKERGQPIEGDRLTERQIYSAPPWELFPQGGAFWNACMESQSSRKKVVFAFSMLPRVSKKRVNRVVEGCGTWEGKSVGCNVVDPAGRVVGWKRSFTFKPKKECMHEAKGHWIMHELSVGGYNYVVCRITADFTKKIQKDEEVRHFNKRELEIINVEDDDPNKRPRVQQKEMHKDDENKDNEMTRMNPTNQIDDFEFASWLEGEVYALINETYLADHGSYSQPM